MDIYEKNGKSIAYVIIKKRIKRTYLRVQNGHIRITTNLYTSKKQLVHYIDKIFDQLYNQLEKQQLSRLKDNEIVLWGKKYSLEIVEGKFEYYIKDQHVYVRTQMTDFKKIKEHIYLNETKAKYLTLKDQIDQVISQKGLKELPFKFKFLKSKYGSYHRQHQEITLNTFLATLDEIFLIYVIYHEYAHALVFNHSKDFYNLLDEFMPNHRLYQKDLKRIAIL